MSKRGRYAIHGLAMISLLVVAGMSLHGTWRMPADTLGARILSLLLGMALWGFLIKKVWQRPRQWGTGVGIFLALIIVFQTWLWWMAVHRPRIGKAPFDLSFLGFVPYEVPLLVGSICCLLLPRCFSPDPDDGLMKPRQDSP